MSQAETDELHHQDADPPTWRKTPVHLTRGWVVFVVLFAFAFMGMAAYAAVTTVRLDNRVTRETVANSIAGQVDSCQTANDRRDEARKLAEDVLATDQRALDADSRALESDQASWQAIDDLFPTGIPEPARSTVFGGLNERSIDLEAQQAALSERSAQIDTTYAHTDCAALARQLGGTVPATVSTSVEG